MQPAVGRAEERRARLPALHKSRALEDPVGRPLAGRLDAFLGQPHRQLARSPVRVRLALPHKRLDNIASSCPANAARPAASIHKPLCPLATVPLDPLIPGLAAHPKLPAQPAELLLARLPGTHQKHPEIHLQHLFPWRSRILLDQQEDTQNCHPRHGTRCILSSGAAQRRAPEGFSWRPWP